MLSGGLAILGFSACSSNPEDDIVCEYGMPYCSFEIKGKVKNELQEPVNGARIIIKELDNDHTPLYYDRPDTLYTQDGAYKFLSGAVTNEYKYRVVCEDPSGVYKADSTDVTMEPKGGEGWYTGSDTKEVDFTLKKKDE